MWYLVLSTGLRRAELAGLRWRDAALDRVPATLAVRTTRTTAGHPVVEHDPKSKSSRRLVHLDKRTAEVLRDHFGARQRRPISAASSFPEYVFVDEFGDPYHPAQLTATSTRCSDERACRKSPSMTSAIRQRRSPARRGAPEGS